MTTQALILAAGFGNRMRPLTNDVHKTMLEVAGDTILGRIIDSLVRQDIEDVTIVTGYRSDEVRDYVLSRWPSLDITFVHNPQYDKTNNIVSVALALEAMDLKGELVLIESDLIYDDAALASLMRSDHDNVALVSPYCRGMDGTVVRVENGIVVEVIPPHLQPSDFDFSDKFKTLNIYRLSRAFAGGPFRRLVTHYARSIDDQCYYELILGILIYLQRSQIHAAIVDADVWAEVDDPNNLRQAQYLFDKESRLAVLDGAMGGYWSYDLIDFTFIRNIYFPTPAVYAELRNALEPVLQNYGSSQARVTSKLANLLLVNPSRLEVLSGASQVYPILKAMLPDSPALIPSPTFGEYERIFPEAATYADVGGYSLLSVDERVAATKPDVAILVNPNNPTGSTVATQELWDFAHAHSEQLFIVDESFISFSSQPSLISMLEVQALQNVVVIASLSKTFGVPGLRLGYVYSSNSAILAGIRQRLPIWSVNSLAEFFLEILLKHRIAFEESVELTKRDREEFSVLLQATPGVREVWGSGGNFVAVRLGLARKWVPSLRRMLLLEHGCYVKEFNSKVPQVDQGLLRFAVRSPMENRKLVEGLRQSVEQISRENG